VPRHFLLGLALLCAGSGCVRRLQVLELDGPLEAGVAGTFSGTPKPLKWDFGDGTAPTTGLQGTHAWAKAGKYTVQAWDGEALALRSEVTVVPRALLRAVPPQGLEEEARRLVAARTVHVVLVTPAGASGPSIPIRVLADSTNVDSDAMERRVSRVLHDSGAELLRARMTALGQDPAAARPLDLQEEDLADAARRGASFAASLLPYLLLVLVATSGFYAALDLTAGEKERGTLQTLLTAPVRSVEIVAGKYLTVLALTLAATVCNLGSIALALARGTAAMEAGARFSLGLTGAGAIFLTVLPAALLIVALLMAVGVLARSYREGQTYLMHILLLVMLAGFASFLPGAELTAGTALVPLLNVTLLVHDILVGRAGPSQVMIVWGVIVSTSSVVIRSRTTRSMRYRPTRNAS
jgi:sodium transport system permease protein